MLVFKVDDPVFKTKPLFVLGCSYPELAAYLHGRYRINLKPEEGICGIMLTFARPPWRVVWVERISKRPKDLGPLLHELFHLVTRICGDKSVPIYHHITTGECGDETAAYLYEYFADHCLRRIRK